MSYTQVWSTCLPNQHPAGHYKHHPADYRAAVSQLLSQAAICYSQRMQQLSGSSSGIGDSDDRPHKALASNAGRLKGSISCHSPCSVELETEDVGAGEDEKKGDFLHMESPEAIAQILSDICNPKTIERWDIMHSEPLRRRQALSSAKSHGPLNNFRGMQRSKL